MNLLTSKLLPSVLLTVIISSTVSATETAFEREKHFCGAVESGAKLIMGFRQHHPDVTLGDVIIALQEASGENDNPLIFTMGKMMAIDAYSERSPAFGNKALQQQAINDFTNKWSASCWSN